MTLLGEKLKKSGIDTAEARLAVLAFEALRETTALHEAAVVLSQKLTAEPWVIIDMWLAPYLRERQGDMNGNTPAQSMTAPPPLNLSDCHVFKSPVPSRPRPPLPSPEAKAQIDSIIKKAVQHIQFGYKTADGTDWANVGAHELDGMDRDGALARAVKARIGVLTNEDRFRKVGDLMTAKQFNEIAEEVRKHPIKGIMK